MKSPRRGSALFILAALAVAGCSSSGGGTGAPGTTAAATSGAKGDSSAGGSAAGLPSQLTGDLTSTNGFKPGENGFSFQNYGKVDSRPNLTADEMRRFFGDSVCGSTADGKCVLTPPAQQWMEQTSDGMNGGHCEGMAALALLLYKGVVKPDDIMPGATNAFGGKIEGNDKLAKEIAYWWATQMLDPTTTAEAKNLKPSEVTAKLKESFADPSSESYTLGIYKTVDGKRTAGHAITPYGLVDKGNGQIEIAVYDNNFPSQPRAVKVDTGIEKWSYSAAADPTQPESLYEGDASTFSLTITSTSARLKPQTCPFCGATAGATGSKGAVAGDAKGGAGGVDTTATAPGGQLFLNEDAGDKGVVLVVTDPSGQPLPGVTVQSAKNDDGLNAIPDVIQIPAGQAFKVTIDASAVKEPVKADVAYVGGETDQYIDGMSLAPGQKDTATFDPAQQTVTFETTANEDPTIGAGFASAGADYDFSVSGVDLPQGGKVTTHLDQAAGTFTITNDAPAKGTYGLTMDRIDDTAGEVTFTSDAVDLDAGSSLQVAYGTWTTKADHLTGTVTPAGGGAPTALDLTSS